MRQNDNELRFVYIRDAVELDRRGKTLVRPVTVVYRFNDEKRQVEYNISRCSEKDQFVKAIGRMKATKRLLGSKKRPNSAIPYAFVSDDGVNPRYAKIAQEFHSIFGPRSTVH